MKRILLAVMSICFMSLIVNGALYAKSKRAQKDLKSESKKEMQKSEVGQTLKQVKSDMFYVYSDKDARKNHYFPSGHMGDFKDIKVDEGCKMNPQSGSTCIKITYLPNASQGAKWAGVYWQNPANNWGTRPGGFDLTGAKRVVFWARGENGGEVISEFKIGGITGEYADSDSMAIPEIELTKEWKQYTIDLDGVDLSYISGGFVWAAELESNPDGCTVYLDNIYYDFTSEK
ncbi:MAG: hypothetical protein ABII27_02385 [bacterium]